MKRWMNISMLILCLLLFCLVGCSDNQLIPGGYISKEEFFDSNGFQDYTDYCKYYYKDKKMFVNNQEYKKLSESDIKTIGGYFVDFQSWMEKEDRTDEFDFDISCITEGDYVYIETKEPISDSNYGKYDNYTIYFFDADSCVLYYMHQNI